MIKDREDDVLMISTRHKDFAGIGLCLSGKRPRGVALHGIDRLIEFLTKNRSELADRIVAAYKESA